MQREFVRFTRLQRRLQLPWSSLPQPGDDRDDPEVFLHQVGVFLSRLLGGFQTAGYIHRFAAVVMFTAFVTHLVDLRQAEEAKVRHLARDAARPELHGPDEGTTKEFIATLKWFLHLARKPEYGRWTYWEKFDYFAVFWGVFIIGSTGLTLWFPVFFTRFLPGAFINVATIIHSDEALLATGFIFTVHFFNTHLRPEKFPMDTTVFTGRMPLAELRRDKRKEYEALVASGELEDHLAEPHPEIVVRTIRAFAWVALSIGFSIVVWIVYAMLFAYR